MVIFLTATSGIVTAREHVEVDAVWKNSSAEELKEQLISISGKADLTVIGDGKATIYYYAEPSEVAKIQREASGSLAKDLIFVRLERVAGDIPTAPKQSEQKIAMISINRDKALILGIPLSEIYSHIRDLRGDITEKAEFSNKINAKTITIQNGNKVFLRDLIEVKIAEVKRPLILKNDNPSIPRK